MYFNLDKEIHQMIKPKMPLGNIISTFFLNVKKSTKKTRLFNESSTHLHQKVCLIIFTKGAWNYKNLAP